MYKCVSKTFHTKTLQATNKNVTYINVERTHAGYISSFCCRKFLKHFCTLITMLWIFLDF
jgi:hypothetical protein